VETKVLFKVTCVQELSSHFFSFLLLPFLLALIFCYAVCYCEFGINEPFGALFSFYTTCDSLWSFSKYV